MFETGRTQIVVYVAIAAVLALVGFNSLRGGSESVDGFAQAGGAAGTAGGDSATAGGPPGSEAGAGISVSSDRSKLVVDVSGAVRRPGVYEFAQGMRVIDAIERAGGTLPSALPGAINRAAELADGQQVVVPMAAGRGAGAPGQAAGTGPTATADIPISLGTATAAQLEEIDGIGPVTAAAILEFRDTQGGIGSIEELDQVSGIGPVTMEALRSGLTP